MDPKAPAVVDKPAISDRGGWPDPLSAWRAAFGWADASGSQVAWPGMQLAQQAFDYYVDAWQRSMLFLDVLRERGNNYLERSASQVPHVLGFQFELVMRGLELERPVNYGLVRIIPPPGVEIDPRKRPFIVFDPRAGHGPGIGGMKHDSEIGVALADGHPCYFVGFVPEPIPGQTVEDVCHAEDQFIAKVASLHPEAQGKPVLIGNCQAGWQIMMTAAVRPDLVGPIILAGSPMSYWNGVHGKNPMRYLGGIMGGTWLASLAGDLGHGIFDGAHLVANFEDLDPANTYWKKDYNLYSKVDTEGPRFLEFEKWWGSPVLLNAAEMQFITNELFVGNKLSSGEIFTSDGIRIDLRNIKSPIVVFCSWGDNITPPQQALGWILDLYDRDDEIVANGQTIIYALHQTIGHLGIFVSAKVATKEHEEFAQNLDLIDVLPPGLYEAVFTEKGAETAHAELASGNYVVRFEMRTLDDIRALGGNDAEDNQRFATVARISETNQGLYRTMLSPVINSVMTDDLAEWLRNMHPHRLRFLAFSDKNPFMWSVQTIAESIRANRRPVDGGNPFLALQNTVSEQIISAWDAYRDSRDRSTESIFMSVYGSPLVQAMAGMRSDTATARQRIGRDIAREAVVAKAVSELNQHMEQGGLLEAGMRALFYVGLGREVKGVDERSFGVLRQIRAARPENQRMSMSHFKELVRRQYLMLYLDQERAVLAIPKLLERIAPKERSTTLDNIRRIAAIDGPPAGEVKARLTRVETLFAAPPEPSREGWELAAVKGGSQPTGGSVEQRARGQKREEKIPGEKVAEG